VVEIGKLNKNRGNFPISKYGILKIRKLGDIIVFDIGEIKPISRDFFDMFFSLEIGKSSGN
jgi:hypothetical protein